MLYEVVNPAIHEDRGVMYESVAKALIHSGPCDEVWQLADDGLRTRVLRIWPDPEFERVDEVRQRRILKQSFEMTGIAEREASALIQRVGIERTNEVHGLVTAAWLEGCLAGVRFGRDIIESVVPETTTPTAGGN